MNKFLLEIITPERSAFAEEVDSVYVPTPDGRIGVLAHHAALFTQLSEGEVKIVSGNKEYYLAIGGGFMDVGHNKASILVSRAAHADELNETEIRKAEESARLVLSQVKVGSERATAQAMLRRSFLELKVLRHRRSERTGVPSMN